MGGWQSVQTKVVFLTGRYAFAVSIFFQTEGLRWSKKEDSPIGQFP